MYKIMVILLGILTIFALNLIVHCQFRYDIEFVEPRMFVKCDDYPDNYLDRAVDMSQLSIEHTDDGTLIMHGSATIIKTLPDNLPVKIETLKKERGTWQPTLFTSRRASLCKAAFDGSEVWATYWKNTPKGQKRCPLTEGKQLDIDVTSDTSVNLPMATLDGEYVSRMEIGEKSDDAYMCADIYVNIHRV